MGREGKYLQLCDWKICMSYLLMSDIHLHAWTSFSTTNADGINSRLQITIDEIRRSASNHWVKGGDKKLVIAGDVFHKRGSIQTSVMNPVLDLFKEMELNDWSIFILSGNHDLESKDSSRISSSVTALENVNLTVYSKTGINEREKLVFVPWFADIKALKDELSYLKIKDKSQYDLIIHAPIDDVIYGLPEHGLTASYLAELGYKNVFAGHYHNHKEFDGGVYSIGATTHQTFSDIGSRAGTLSVFNDKVIYNASHAPKFIDINADNFDEAELLVDGNYVRCRINASSDSEVNELREQFIAWGAKGIIVNQVKDSAITERTGVITSSDVRGLEQSIAHFITLKGYNSSVSDLCAEILSEVEEIA